MKHASTAKLFGLALLLTMGACGEKGIDAHFAPFLKQAVRALDKKNAALEKQWQIPLGTHGHPAITPKLDEKTGILSFFETDKKTKKERALVRATAECVGIYDPKVHIWIWAWADDRIPESVKKKIGRVRDYGHVRQSERLSKASWEAPVEVADQVTAASATVLGADASCFFTQAGLQFYFLLFDLKPGSQSK